MSVHKYWPTCVDNLQSVLECLIFSKMTNFTSSNISKSQFGQIVSMHISRKGQSLSDYCYSFSAHFHYLIFGHLILFW